MFSYLSFCQLCDVWILCACEFCFSFLLSWVHHFGSKLSSWWEYLKIISFWHCVWCSNCLSSSVPHAKCLGRLVRCHILSYEISGEDVSCLRREGETHQHQEQRLHASVITVLSTCWAKITYIWWSTILRICVSLGDVNRTLLYLSSLQVGCFQRVARTVGTGCCGHADNSS